MFTPLYLSLIPIINYAALGRVKGRFINVLFPAIYSVIIMVNLVSRGVSSFPLSTVPFIEGHYLPIILVLDYHAVCFLTAIALIYLYVASTGVYAENPYVLVALSASTLVVVSTDVLFSTLMLLVVLTYLHLFRRMRIAVNYVVYTLLLTLAGFLLTNSFNIYLTRYLVGFNYVDAGAAGLGLLLYAAPYALTLLTAVGVKPFDPDGGLEVYDRVLLCTLSASFLIRLMVVMKNIGGGLTYWIYALFTTPLFIVNYVINHVDYGKLDKSLVYGEIQLLPVLSILLSPIAYASSVAVVSSTITHLFLNNIFGSADAVKASKTLIPISPGFVAYLVAIHSLLSTLPPGVNLALAAVVVFTLIIHANNLYAHGKLELRRKTIVLNTALGLALGVYVYTFAYAAGEQLFNLSLYLRLIGL